MDCHEDALVVFSFTFTATNSPFRDVDPRFIVADSADSGIAERCVILRDENHRYMPAENRGKTAATGVGRRLPAKERASGKERTAVPEFAGPEIFALDRVS